MGWICKTCGAKSASDSLTFPMMHEHENVEPDIESILPGTSAIGDEDHVFGVHGMRAHTTRRDLDEIRVGLITAATKAAAVREMTRRDLDIVEIVDCLAPKLEMQIRALRERSARGEALMIAQESAFISEARTDATGKARPLGHWRLRCGHRIWMPEDNLVAAIVNHKQAFDEME